MTPVAPPLRPDSPALGRPPGSRRFPLVDACRGSAALVVVAGHMLSHPAHGVLGNLVNEMQAAVQVFFAISGFLLLRPYLVARAHGAPEPRARDFLRRRALRILPAYWFALTALTLLLGSLYLRDVFSSRWWLYYGLGQVYSLSHVQNGLAIAWSLSVEASFYVCMPLFAALTAWLGRRWGWRRGVLVPIGMALRPMAFLGVVSYGVYLWHVPLAQWLANNTPLGDVLRWPLLLSWPVAFAIVASVSLTAGTLSYYLVELPFLRLKPGRRARSEPPVAAEPEPVASVAH